jgi:hypothetical protein
VSRLAAMRTELAHDGHPRIVARQLAFDWHGVEDFDERSNSKFRERFCGRFRVLQV